LAFALTHKHIRGWDRVKGESLKLAWQAVERLFEIDPASPMGHTMRGEIRVFRGEHDAALSDFRRAHALNPNSTWNLFWMACAEATSGLTREAKEHAERGLRLSPRDLDIGLGIAHIALFEASFVEGDFKTAKEWGARAIQLQAKAPWRQSLMVACCGHLGELDEAARHVAEINSFAPGFLSSLCRGELSWFKKPEHTALLMEGLRKAGLHVPSDGAAAPGRASKPRHG
jgi:adenylate cyclase